MIFPAGTIIDGRFEVTRMLGAGSYGAVYRAEDLSMSRTVAVKVLRAPAAIDRNALERFEREAKILSVLQHENVVHVFSFGQCDDGVPYLVMPFLEGESLRQRLDRERRLRWEDVVPIAKQICAGAQAAHKAGVIHRDLKPENVMLSAADRGGECAKILDFGMSAFRIGPDSDSQKLTETGMVVGTPQYMSPECALGQAATNLSDVYSLGCMMYEMLSGVQPFVRTDVMDILYAHLHEDAPAFPADLGIPERLQRIVLKAMHKVPASRFASMEKFGEALELTEEVGAAAKPLAPRRKKTALFAAGVAVAVVGIVTAMSLAPHTVPPSPERIWQEAQDAGSKLWQKNDYDSALDAYEAAAKAAPNEKQWQETEAALEAVLHGHNVLRGAHRDPSVILDNLVQVAVVGNPNRAQRDRAALILSESYLRHEGSVTIHKRGREIVMDRKDRAADLIDRVNTHRSRRRGQ